MASPIQTESVEWRVSFDEMRDMLRAHFSQEFAQRLRSPVNVAKAVFMAVVLNAIVWPPRTEDSGVYAYFLVRIILSLGITFLVLKWWGLKQFKATWSAIESAPISPNGIVQSLTKADSKITVTTNGTVDEYSKNDLTALASKRGLLVFSKSGAPVIWIPDHYQGILSAVGSMMTAPEPNA